MALLVFHTKAGSTTSPKLQKGDANAEYPAANTQPPSLEDWEKIPIWIGKIGEIPIWS